MNKKTQEVKEVVAFKTKQEKRKEFINTRFEEDKKYYSEKLQSMVSDTLSVIDGNTTAEELANLLKIGDKEWKSICSRARATRKLSIPIDWYMQTMVYELQTKKLLQPATTEKVKEIRDQE